MITLMEYISSNESRTLLKRVYGKHLVHSLIVLDIISCMSIICAFVALFIEHPIMMIFYLFLWSTSLLTDLMLRIHYKTFFIAKKLGAIPCQ